MNDRFPQALAESSQLFAVASTDLARLLGVIARRFSERVGEAANIRLIEGDAPGKGHIPRQHLQVLISSQQFSGACPFTRRSYDNTCPRASRAISQQAESIS